LEIVGNIMNIPINNSAPVKSQGEIEINAPVENVWHILTTINDWPSWQSEVTESSLNGGLAEGVEFKWKAGGLPFSSEIHTIITNKEFGWTGKTYGTSAIHNWYFSDQGGKTLLKVEESLQGVLPGLLKNYFQKNLDRGIKQNLEELKSASEK
jgi:uncharacterized protein YndB with AHSA1/START domain